MPHVGPETSELPMPSPKRNTSTSLLPMFLAADVVARMTRLMMRFNADVGKAQSNNGNNPVHSLPME